MEVDGYSINNLPYELIIPILKQTNAKSCLAMSQVSYEYRWILNEEKLWTSFDDNHCAYTLALARATKRNINNIRYRWNKNIKKVDKYFIFIFTGGEQAGWLYKDERFTGETMEKVYIKHKHPYCMCTISNIQPKLSEGIWLKVGVYKIYDHLIRIKSHTIELMYCPDGCSPDELSRMAYDAEEYYNSAGDVRYCCSSPEPLLYFRFLPKGLQYVRPSYLYSGEVERRSSNQLV